MSEIMQQKNVIDYIQLTLIIDNQGPSRAAIEFMSYIIDIIIEDLEKSKNEWLEEWQ